MDGMAFLLFPFAIVDLPVAVVSDTLLLTSDMQKSRRKKADAIRQQSEIENATELVDKYGDHSQDEQIR